MILLNGLIWLMICSCLKLWVLEGGIEAYPYELTSIINIFFADLVLYYI